MSRAEKFIKGCTKNYSNVVAYSGMIEGSELRYHPWLIPDEAREAVKIAREELLEDICEWLNKNVTYIHPRKGTKTCIVNLSYLRQAMKEE